MIRIFGGNIYTLLYRLESFSNAVENDALILGRDRPVNEDLQAMWNIHSHDLQQSVEKLKLKRTGERLDRLIIPDIIDNKRPVHLVIAEMNELKHAVEMDLTEITFFYMPPDQFSFWTTTEWEGVLGKLSLAIDKELLFAGRCFATENYTACVFHLMRTVEVALKMVLRRMKATKYLVTSIHGGKTLVPKPVELADWEMVIRALEQALAQLEHGSKTNVRRKETFAYYSGIAASFRNFKDAWRNKVSHSNKIYQKYEAAHIIVNTKQFLNELLPRFKASEKI